MRVERAAAGDLERFRYWNARLPHRAEGPAPAPNASASRSEEDSSVPAVCPTSSNGITMGGRRCRHFSSALYNGTPAPTGPTVDSMIDLSSGSHGLAAAIKAD